MNMFKSLLKPGPVNVWLHLVISQSSLLSTCVIAAHCALAVVILIKMSELVVLIGSQLLNLIQY